MYMYIRLYNASIATDFFDLLTDFFGGAISTVLSFAITVFNTLIYDPTLNTGAGGFTDIFQYLFIMGLFGMVVAIVTKFTKRF